MVVFIIIGIILVILLGLGSSTLKKGSRSGSNGYVKGHYRKDGSYVQGHFRNKRRKY